MRKQIKKDKAMMAKKGGKKPRFANPRADAPFVSGGVVRYFNHKIVGVKPIVGASTF